MKKKLSLLTIVFVSASAVIAILALFGVVKIKGTIADLLWTFLVLTISGILTLNSCTMLEKRNKLAIVSLLLIGVSALLVILSFWTSIGSKGYYLEVTLTACILSVCFNVITSNILKLGSNYKYIQIVSYFLFMVLAVFLIMTSWGSNIIVDWLKIFLVFAILSFVAICILSVVSKKQMPVTFNDDAYVKITKKEYEDLLLKKKQLESLLEKKND